MATVDLLNRLAPLANHRAPTGRPLETSSLLTAGRKRHGWKQRKYAVQKTLLRPRAPEKLNLHQPEVFCTMTRNTQHRGNLIWMARERRAVHTSGASPARLRLKDGAQD